MLSGWWPGWGVTNKRMRMSMDADASPSGKRGHTSFHGKNTSIFRITKKFKLFVEQLEKAMVVLSAAWAIFLPHSPSRCPLHTLPMGAEAGCWGRVLSCLSTRVPVWMPACEPAGQVSPGVNYFSLSLAFLICKMKVKSASLMGPMWGLNC